MIRASLLFAFGVASCAGESSTPPGLANAAHPTSETCSTCHADIFEAWQGSHHDRAMQHATPATVLGDFGAAPLTWARGDEVHTTSFRRDGADFFMRTEGDLANHKGEDTDFRIAFTFGVEPLQQYLVETSGGILQCLPIAWDTLAERWFHLDPELPVGDTLHWTGRMQRWNMMCAECHSTELKKGYDSATDTYQTTYSEIDVGCRACHGSADEHVRLAQSWDEGKTPNPGSKMGFEGNLDPAKAELETCAPCHSRRSALTDSWTPGELFLDHYDPALLRAGLYFPDGQIQDEVYVWGSFSQSRMHQAGVTCSDCHDPHSLQLRLPEGPGHNELCVQCHSEAAPIGRFPTLLAKSYDTPDHHHHESGSEAARCTTCHMPTRTYMGVDERHDHSMGIPRPDLSQELAVPNACATCHTSDAGEDDAWAAGEIRSWRAPTIAARTISQRALDGLLAKTFSGARALGDATANKRESLFENLLSLVDNTELPALQRATALELLADFGPASLATITSRLQDAEPLIRVAAARAVRRFPQASGLSLKLREAQLDPVTAVRVAAAAPVDFERYHALNADFPSSHFDRGMWDQVLGNYADTEARWRKALALDPDFLPAVYNLSVLLSAQGRGAQAATLLSDALRRHPDEGELAYSLGLQLAELGNSKQSLSKLALAAKLLPDRPRIAYNLGLAHSAANDLADAELELRRAIGLHANNKAGAADATYALAVLLLRTERNSEAELLARELDALGIPIAKELLAELSRRE